MNVQDIAVVSSMILKGIEKRKIVEMYKNVINTYSKAEKKSDPNISKQLVEATDNLKAVLIDVYPEHWGRTERTVYDQLRASAYIGEVAQGQIDKLVQRNIMAAGEAGRIFSKRLDELNRFRENLKSIQNILKPFMTPNEEIETEEKSLVRIVFDGKSYFTTLDGLKDASNKWINIIRVVSYEIRPATFYVFNFTFCITE